MGLLLKRALIKLARVAIVGVILAFALQTYLRQRQEDFYSGNAIFKHAQPESQHDTSPTPPLALETEPEADFNATVWQLMLQDPTISRFVELNEPFPMIKGPLSNPNENWTLYVPIDPAFQNAIFPFNPPVFYWLFLSLNHIGGEAVSYEDLLASTTVESRVNHDVYFRYRQRVSVKDKNGELVFNRVAKYVGQPLKAVNGYVHHIDSMLHLPDACSDALRSDPDFSTFRRALIFTDVAARVNDSQGHVSQTIFAPSNAAFEKLGRKANDFLFSPWGKPYMAALLRNHVVENSTLFSDIYFRAKGAGQVRLDTMSEPTILPTLNSGVDLKTSIVLNGHRQSIRINDKVVVSDPDIIAMDGVIHKIDELLLPEAQLADEAGETSAEETSSWFNSLWPWNSASSEILVEELMERLQPLMAKGEAF